MTRFTQDNFGNRYIWKSDEGMHSRIEQLITHREKVELGKNNDIPLHNQLISKAFKDKKEIPDHVLADYPDSAHVSNLFVPIINK